MILAPFIDELTIFDVLVDGRGWQFYTMRDRRNELDASKDEETSYTTTEEIQRNGLLRGQFRTT